MADLGSAPSEQCQQSADTRGCAEEMRERMRPLSELDGLDARLVKQHRALEDVHRRSVEPWSEVHELASVFALPFDHRGGCFAGEPRRMEHVVILQNPHDLGPLESGQRDIHRASDGIVKGQDTRRLPGS